MFDRRADDAAADLGAKIVHPDYSVDDIRAENFGEKQPTLESAAGVLTTVVGIRAVKFRR